MNKKDTKIYHIGFHIIPTLDKNGVSAAYKKIVDDVAKVGTIIEQEETQEIELAYTIRHHKRNTDGTYDTFSEAHFGTIKFEAEPAKIPALKKSTETDTNIMRCLVIETIKEETRVGDILPDVNVKAKEVEEAPEAPVTPQADKE